jgi:hypothetical protein
VHLNAKSVFGWCVITLLLKASLAGQSRDLRLVEAVKTKNMAVVPALLKQKVDVNTPSPMVRPHSTGRHTGTISGWRTS